MTAETSDPTGVVPEDWAMDIAREISHGKTIQEIEAITQYMRDNPLWGIPYYDARKP